MTPLLVTPWLLALLTDQRLRPWFFGVATVVSVSAI
jgi:hypothetical protein